MAYIAYLSMALTHLIMGTNDPTEEFENISDHIFKAAEGSLFGGQFSRVLPFLYDKKATAKNRVSRTVLGPGPNMLLDVADGLVSPGSGKLAKAAANLTPGLNVFKSSKEALTEEYESLIEGFLGAFE
jgi:hypothetical protein